MQIYLVGGAVRDQLLGRASKDKDWVVVGSTPQEMLALGYQQVGADFPVFLHPQSKEEYALARKERKNGRGYQGFICDFSPDISLEDDLQRRDLTINAMAVNQNGDIVDPFGGQADLRNKQLRHVSAAFSEDPLRVLRVARFSARFYQSGFRIAPPTMKLMREIADTGELTSLTPERVWQETARALTEKHPDVFFRNLSEAHALRPLFPEIASLFGKPQRIQTSPDHLPSDRAPDAGEHALQTLANSAGLSANIDTRFAALLFAALLHALGAANTPASFWPDHVGFEKASTTLIQGLCQRLKTPKSTRELAVLVAQHYRNAQLALQLTPEDVVSLLDACDVWRRPERFSQFLLVCEAEARTRLNYGCEQYKTKEFLQKAAQTAKEVDTKALLNRGYKGLALKQQIRLMRANKIRAIYV